MYPIAVSLAASMNAPPPKGKVVSPAARVARYGPSGQGIKNSRLNLQVSDTPGVAWAPGGLTPAPAKKQIVFKLPIPKQTVAFVLPQSPARPAGRVTYGRTGFQPLPPMTIVPHGLALKPAAPARPVSAAPAPPAGTTTAPAPKPADDASYPLTPLSEDQPLSGSNRAVASVIQELATREKLKVIIGPTEGKTVTVRLGDVEPETALRRVTKMAGLSLRKHEDVWYVATPEWMVKAFPERVFTNMIQLPTDDAASLASALQKVLGVGTEVEAAGGNHLIVKASIADLETTAYVLAQWPVDPETKVSPLASLALDLPDGFDESTFRLAGMAESDALKVERAEKGRSFILRGTPTAVMAGLKTYVAVIDRAQLPSRTVARRIQK